MKLQILAIGKKHEDWVEPGVKRYLSRLRPPFAAEFDILPHSSKEYNEARREESDRLISRIKPNDFVILLDERGKNLSSPELSELLISDSAQRIVIIIGGAYGVDERITERADVTWSLSRLVFPHQLVRLILTEQLYRAQEIYRGSDYHHL